MQENPKKKKKKTATTDSRYGGGDQDPDLSLCSRLVEVEFSEDVKSGNKADETEAHDENNGR